MLPVDNPKQTPDLAPRTPVYERSAKPDRGGCLVLWIVVSFGASLLALLPFLQIVSIISNNPLAARRVSSLAVLLLGMMILTYLVSLCGIWIWKRWGVYGVAVAVIASPVIESMLGTATSSDCVAPFVQLGILYYLLKDKWDYFD